MDSKKRNVIEEPFESFMQEFGSEAKMKEPPPTPSLSLRQKSGSVPDIRIKERATTKAISCKNINQCVTYRKTILKPKMEIIEKKSPSEQSLTSKNGELLHWLVMGQVPLTCHVLHSVRQKLLNL